MSVANPTEAEYILIDIIILKFPINQPMTTNGLYHDVLVGLQDKHSPEIYEEIKYMVVSNNSTVRQFLLKWKYIDCVDFVIGKDKLSPKGEKAQELGGHKQYLEWEINEIKKKNIEEWPKKRWYLYEPIRIIVAVAITAGVAIPISYFKGKNDASKNTHINSRQLRQLTHLKDTALHLPKTSDKKDSL